MGKLKPYVSALHLFLLFLLCIHWIYSFNEKIITELKALGIENMEDISVLYHPENQELMEELLSKLSKIDGSKIKIAKNKIHLS